jgi:hypothetical protein
MAHRLKTPEGRALYALRKQTPEPVFGIIKAALGFRRMAGGPGRATPSGGADPEGAQRAHAL